MLTALFRGQLDLQDVAGVGACHKQRGGVFAEGEAREVAGDAVLEQILQSLVLVEDHRRHARDVVDCVVQCGEKARVTAFLDFSNRLGLGLVKARHREFEVGVVLVTKAELFGLVERDHASGSYWGVFALGHRLNFDLVDLALLVNELDLAVPDLFGDLFQPYLVLHRRLLALFESPAIWQILDLADLDFRALLAQVVLAAAQQEGVGDRLVSRASQQGAGLQVGAADAAAALAERGLDVRIFARGLAALVRLLLDARGRRLVHQLRGVYLQVVVLEGRFLLCLFRRLVSFFVFRIWYDLEAAEQLAGIRRGLLVFRTRFS